MASNTLDTQSLPIATLVTFSWDAGDGWDNPDARLYTNWTSDLTIGGDAFVSNPGLVVKYPAFDGTTNESPLYIEAPERIGDPMSGPPLEPLVWMVGQPFNKTKVHIEEVNPADPSTRRTMYRGKVFFVYQNPDGRSGIYKADVRSAKGDLDGALGLQILDVCPWILGDPITCKFPIETLRETGTITAINNAKLTITGLSDHDADPGYWQNGYAMIAGLRVKVRKWQAGTEFMLTRVPPSSWLSSDVVMTPGCDKKPATCLGRYNNQANIGCIGLETPDRNVQTEQAAN